VGSRKKIARGKGRCPPPGGRRGEQMGIYRGATFYRGFTLKVLKEWWVACGKGAGLLAASGKKEGLSFYGERQGEGGGVQGK